MCNFVGRPLLLWQRNFGKFGLFFDKIAHESSCMPDRPDMFGPTSGDDQRDRPFLPRQRHLRQARSLIAYRLVCMYVCNAPSNRFFFFFSLFLDGIEPFLGHQFSMTKTTKRCFSNFDLLPWQRYLGYFCKNFKLLFLFVFRWNRAIFWPLVLREPLYKTLFFDFWFRLPNPQNWLPKIWPKIAYNSACVADRPEMFAPNRGFSGTTDWMEPYKMLSGRPLLPWQRKIGKFWLIFHKNRFFFSCLSMESTHFWAVRSPCGTL